MSVMRMLNIYGKSRCSRILHNAIKISLFGFSATVYTHLFLLNLLISVPHISSNFSFSAWLGWRGRDVFWPRSRRQNFRKAARNQKGTGGPAKDNNNDGRRPKACRVQSREETKVGSVSLYVSAPGYERAGNKCLFRIPRALAIRLRA